MKSSILVSLFFFFLFQIDSDLTSSSHAQQTSQPGDVEKAIREIELSDKNYGWAATDHSLLETTDGGNSWREIRKAAKKSVSTAAEPYRDGQGFIERIQILSRNEGWILEDSALLQTTDSGASWKKYNPEYIDIRSFRFVDRNKGWSVAQHLFYGDYKPFTRAGEIYETRDGGLHWQQVPVGLSLEGIWLLDM